MSGYPQSLGFKGATMLRQTASLVFAVALIVSSCGGDDASESVAISGSESAGDAGDGIAGRLRT